MNFFCKKISSYKNLLEVVDIRGLNTQIQIDKQMLISNQNT